MPTGYLVGTPDATLIRLTAAAVDLQRAQKDVDDARERRDRLVWQAIDDGHSYRQVAAAAKLYASGVVKVLARRHAWQDELAGGHDSPGERTA